jgi:hypothetical protein
MEQTTLTSVASPTLKIALGFAPTFDIMQLASNASSLGYRYEVWTLRELSCRPERMGVYMQSCRCGDKNCVTLRLIGAPHNSILNLHSCQRSHGVVPSPGRVRHQFGHRGTAYGLLIGLGVGFCGVIAGAVKIQELYLAEDSGSQKCLW